MGQERKCEDFALFKNRKKHPHFSGCRRQFILLNNIRFDFLQEFVTIIAVNFRLDWVCKVEAEDTHNGFCIDCISAGDEIYIEIILGDNVDEIFHIVDGTQKNVDCFHNFQPPKIESYFGLPQVHGICGVMAWRRKDQE